MITKLPKIQFGVFDAQIIPEVSVWKISFPKKFITTPVVVIAPMLGDSTNGALDGVRISGITVTGFEVENQYKNTIEQKIYWVAISN